MDKERFTTIHIHKTYNIPNWGRDKSSIARNIQSSKRKGKLAFIIIFDFKVLIYKNLFHILLANAQKKETPVKRTHASSSKKTKKAIVIDSDDENSNKENKVAYNLEYQEKALALKERELLLREREAHVHALELSNFEKEQRLKSAN